MQSRWQQRLVQQAQVPALTAASVALAAARRRSISSCAALKLRGERGPEGEKRRCGHKHRPCGCTCFFALPMAACHPAPHFRCPPPVSSPRRRLHLELLVVALHRLERLLARLGQHLKLLGVAGGGGGGLLQPGAQGGKEGGSRVSRL